MKKLLTSTIVLLLLSLNIPLSLAHSEDQAPEPMSLDALLSAFGWDLEKAQITSQTVAEELHVLFGVGGNIAVNIGSDGVFMVDDQFPQLMPKIKDAIKSLGGDKIDFAVTTHWHFDHAEGNLALGPEGVWLVAQENSREMMKGDHLVNLVSVSYDQKAYPEAAWPDITFKNDMQFHYNGQQIDLLHFGPAHTTGDAAVVFRGANAVHMGDVFNNSGYPFIDAGNGGQLEGVINFCKKVLSQIDANTIVIPGHGPVANYQALEDYVTMLSTVRDRLAKLIADGASLEEVFAANPTAEFDKIKGNNTMFINRAYMSMKHSEH